MHAFMPEDKETSAAEQLREQLCLQAKSCVERLSDDAVAEADRFCEGYKTFVGQCKTEREAAAWVLERATAAGFVPYDAQQTYAPGSKVYVNNRGKAVILAVLGTQSLAQGAHITAAHIDSPRLDLKPQPFYEEKELALAKTHYYGGIKNYQWAAIPLALHGVVVKTDGQAVPICVGEQPGEPQFCISDLLPHLGKQQRKRTTDDVIEGEELNLILGSRTLMLAGKAEGIKLQLLKILHDTYGLCEADFSSAELEAVPAFAPADIGFDRGLVGAYGHDDRVCAYPAAEALFALKNAPAHTSICVLADKEEIGSYGNTGLQSNFFVDFLYDLATAQNVNPRQVLRASKCLSADVCAALDPTFASVMDPYNAALLGHGVALMKYTGHGGKSGSSDANAEYVAWVRQLLEANQIPWQITELGKVDAGGGGTVALYLAKLNLDVIDIGVPLLSMHAPFELASKLDIAMLHKAISAFYAA